MPQPATAATRAFLDGPPRLIIGSEFVTGRGRAIAVENPAAGAQLVEVFASSLDQVDDAISAARYALHGDWGRKSVRADA